MTSRQAFEKVSVELNGPLDADAVVRHVDEWR